MAKPDLEDGYLRIAHELFAALACAGFTKWEWVVIREVLDQVYGIQKRKTAIISPTEIASRVSTYKQSIVRATSTLVACNVLVKVGEMEYRFIKDYETWTDGKQPRLSQFEGRYCGYAKPSYTSTKPGNNGAYTSTELGNNGAANGKRLRFPTEAPALPPALAPPVPPVLERTRTENKETTTIQSESSSFEIELPEYPNPETSIITVQSGDHSIPETEARKIWGHIWRQWQNPKLCFGFYEMQRWVSVKGWLHAIETAVKQGTTPGHIKYLQKIGMDADINGIKKPKPLNRGSIGPVEYVPTYERPEKVVDISEHVLESERLTRMMIEKGMIN